MTAMDKLIEVIRNSSATPEEKIAIIEALISYVTSKG